MGVAPRSDPRRGLGLLAQGKPSNERQRCLRGATLGFAQKNNAPPKWGAGKTFEIYCVYNKMNFRQRHIKFLDDH